MTAKRRQGKRKVEAEPLSLKRYLHESRRVSVSLVFIAPLFLAYEIAVFFSDREIQNAAEQLVKSMFWYLGPGKSLVHLFLVCVFGLAVFRVVREKIPVFRLYLPFLVESLLLALLLGPLVSFLNQPIDLSAGLGEVPNSFRGSMLASLGAGIYEEMLFRLAILGGLFVLLKRVLGVNQLVSLVLAILVSSLAFAAYHHLGPYGDPLDLRTFTFRAFAGVLLGLIFVGRGLGVVVYLHAIYDLLYDLREIAWD